MGRLGEKDTLLYCYCINSHTNCMQGICLQLLVKVLGKSQKHSVYILYDDDPVSKYRVVCAYLPEYHALSIVHQIWNSPSFQTKE